MVNECHRPYAPYALTEWVQQSLDQYFFSMTYLILTLILALVTAAFALQNTGVATIKFLFWEYQTSLVLVILGSAGLGAVLTFLASLGGRWKRIRTRRSLESTVHSQGERIRELEEKLRLAHETPRPPASG